MLSTLISDHSISKDEILDKLLALTIEEPDVLENDYKRCFKYPYIACETLCFNTEDLMDRFMQVDKPELTQKRLKKLYSAFILHEDDEELNSTIVGFASKIIEKYVKSFPSKVLPYIFAKEYYEDILFKELDDFSVINVIVKSIALQYSCSDLLVEIDTKIERRKEIVNKIVQILAETESSNPNQSIYTKGKLQSTW